MTSEINKLETTNKEKSTLNKILIGSAVGLLLIGLLGYRNFKSKQKVATQQQQLQQQQITELEKDKQLLAIDAMLKGQEEERSRIAKDLHDGLGGMLSGTKLSFINMKENLLLTPENATLFDKSISMLDNTIADLRKVAHNLMPEALVKFGLDEAVKDFCSSIQTSSTLKVVYQKIGENRKLTNTAEVFTYRIIQELVNNAVKHAAAKQIIVQLNMGSDKLHITVEDDGKGFDINNMANSKGAGMDNIKYRVQYFNGTLDIVTTPGSGTSVNIDLAV
jgi:two-component system, NarL family, sensor kinase